jgi:hypothetical protein
MKINKIGSELGMAFHTLDISHLEAGDQED